jgi:hypothetical protein
VGFVACKKVATTTTPLLFLGRDELPGAQLQQQPVSMFQQFFSDGATLTARVGIVGDMDGGG